MNVEIDTGAGCNVMPLYKVKELFGQQWLVQRLSPSTVRIKAYSDQEVKVLGSIVLYMHTSEKTDRVTWQVTNTTGVPILGKSQAKHMNYVRYLVIHAPASQNSLKSTDYVHSLETMHCSLQSKRTAPDSDSLQTPEDHRMATRAKSDVKKEQQSPEVTWCKDTVTINGKVHPLPTNKEYILHEYAHIFKGVATLPEDPYHIRFKDYYKPAQHPPRSGPLGKMQFKSTDCKVSRHRLTPEEVRIDPKKTEAEAITQMDAPQNKASSQSNNSKVEDTNIDIIPVHHIMHSAPVSQARLQELRLATQSDPTLCSVSKTVYEGWPQSRKDCPEQLLEFWNFRQEISEENGIQYKSHRLIVPHSERLETLRVLHMGHYAVDKMQLRALETVYWPGINKDIPKQYQSCKTCIRHSRSQTCEPLQSHPTPEIPWYAAATDLFEIKNSKYLLIVDYYSRFPVLHKLVNTTSRVLIQEMKAVFTELGVPSVIVSDGGTQYTSAEFKDFTKQWQINHSLITKIPTV